MEARVAGKVCAEDILHWVVGIRGAYSEKQALRGAVDGDLLEDRVRGDGCGCQGSEGSGEFHACNLL